MPNLLSHVDNITNVYEPARASWRINRFPTDTDAELALVEDRMRASWA